MKQFSAALAIVLTTAAGAQASGGAGTTASPFLKIPVSARAVGMGGSLGAVDGDAGTIDYNPAGLAGLTRTDIQATYIDYLEDTTLNSVLVGFPIRTASKPALEPLTGAEYARDHVSLGMEYRLFRAKDTARDINGVKGSDFDIRDQLAVLGLSMPVMSKMSIGISGKMISNKLQDKSANSYAFDTGADYKLNSRWALGFALQNFGSSKALDKQSDPLPSSVRASVAYNIPGWLVSGDISSARDGVTRETAGVEWSLGRYLHLRGGTYHDTTLEFTGGLGIQFSGPQKASTPARKPPSSSSDTSAGPSDVANQILARSTDKLTTAFNDAKTGLHKPTLLVLPLKSREKAAAQMTDILARDFARKSDFTALPPSAAPKPADAEDPEKIFGADVVVMGSVEKFDDRYAVSTRLVTSQDGKVVANDYFEIAVDDFDGRPAKMKLSDAPESSVASEFSHVDLALDYGLQTNKDLGITNTITIKILY